LSSQFNAQDLEACTLGTAPLPDRNAMDLLLLAVFFGHIPVLVPLIHLSIDRFAGDERDRVAFVPGCFAVKMLAEDVGGYDQDQ
jgi:hypothetical protein